MADLAELGIAVDSSQMVKATGDGDRFSASMDRAASSAGKLSSGAAQTSAGMAQNAQATKAGAAATNQYTAEQERVIKSLNSQIAAVTLSGREFAVHSALMKANTAESSVAGRAIADLAGQQFDLQHASENASDRISEQRLKFRALSEAANQLGGPLGSVIQQAGYLTIGSQHLTVGLVGTAVAAGAVVAGIGKVVEAYKELAAIGDISKRVGISGAQFQQLEFAGGLKGLSTDAVSKGAQSLAANLNEGVKYANELSQLFGLNNKSLIDSTGHAKSLVDVYVDLGDLVKNARTEQDKFAIAQAAGLEPSRQQIAFLEQGGAAIRKAMEGTRGATDEQLAKAKELDDAWNKLTTQLSMGWRQVAVDATNAMSKMNPNLVSGGIPGAGIVTSLYNLATGQRASSSASPDTGRLSFLLEQQKELNAQLENYRKLSDNPSNPFAERSAEVAAVIQQRFEAVNAEIEKIRAQPPIQAPVAGAGVGGVAGAAPDAVSSTKLVADLTRQTADEADRHLAAVRAIAASYKGVSVETALILEKQKDELRIAEAVTSAQRLAAQEIQTQNQFLLQGKTLEEATRIAAGQRAIAQAQINSGARENLLALRDQAAVAGAVTGEQQIQAAGQATYNALIRQGVDSTIAMAIAAEQVANAHKAANAEVERQIYSLNQATDLLASGNDMNVKAAQAYDNAIRSGASSTKAAALEAAVLENEMTKAAAAAAKIPQVMGFATTWMKNAGEVVKQGPGGGKDITGGNLTTMLQLANEIAKITGQTINISAQIAQATHTPLASIGFVKGLQQQLDFYKRREVLQSPENMIADREIKGENYQTILNDLISGRVGGKDPDARLKAELDVAKYGGQDPNKTLADLQSGLLGQGAQPSQIRDAMDQLREEIKSNTEATNANNNILSDIYTTDPRLSHIGYRAESGVFRNQIPVGPMADTQTLPPGSIVPGISPSLSQPITSPLGGIGPGGPTAIPGVHGFGIPPLTDAQRRTLGGLINFADGGIMTPWGRVLLNKYDGGGIASSPQLAMFGEGDGPEAYVPLKGGTIPVTIKSANGKSNEKPTQIINVYQTLQFLSDADAGDVKRGGFMMAQDLGRQLGGPR